MRLIVAIHDISPARLAHAQLLRAMVGRIAPGPVSLLVIPRRGARERWGDLPGQAWLARRAAEGDEIVVHGWTHSDARGRDGAETPALARAGALVLGRCPDLRLDLHTADVEHPRLLARGRALTAVLVANGRVLTTHSRVCEGHGRFSPPGGKGAPHRR
ncbi:MAG: DUF2334 domain-containing protein [Miltoncostaeaceae bacterium]